MFDRFNGPARRALQLAFREARRRQHDFVGTEHLLFGLLCDHSSPCVAALCKLVASPETLQARLEEVLHDEEPGAALEQFPLSPAVQRALRFAAEEAGQLGQAIIGPEHLLLGLLREPDTQAGVVLGPFGVEIDAARRVVREQPAAERTEHLMQSGARTPPAGPDPTPQELLALVGPVLPAAQGPVTEPPARPAGAEAHPPDIAAPVLADTVRHASEVENQLRKTQLVLGAFLGFYFGQVLVRGGWQLGVLGALAGACLALLRSSFAGAWMGFMAGCVFLPGFFPDGDESIGGVARIIFGVAGALLGSFLGDFWRRPQPAAEVTHAHPDQREDKEPHA